MYIPNSISDIEEMENARRKLKKGQKKPVSQKMFKVV
jgi:predicted DNA-binding protein